MRIQSKSFLPSFSFLSSFLHGLFLSPSSLSSWPSTFLPVHLEGGSSERRTPVFVEDS